MPYHTFGGCRAAALQAASAYRRWGNQEIQSGRLSASLASEGIGHLQISACFKTSSPSLSSGANITTPRLQNASPMARRSGYRRCQARLLQSHEQLDLGQNSWVRNWQEMPQVLELSPAPITVPFEHFLAKLFDRRLLGKYNCLPNIWVLFFRAHEGN
jgi:hypothetical protein